MGTLLNIACAFLAVSSNALFKKAFYQKIAWKGNLYELVQDLWDVMQHLQIWFGLVAFTAANILWFFIVATQPMSIAYPVQVALVLFLAPIFAMVFFGEKVSPLGGAGLVLIFSGVVLVKMGLTPNDGSWPK